MRRESATVSIVRFRSWPLAIAIGLLAVAGCGSSPPQPSATAALVVTPAQASVATSECPSSHCGTLTGQREVVTSITVRETAGVGGTIRRVTLSLRRQSDNALVGGGDEGQGVRFTGGGSVSVPISVHYDQTLGERNMKIVVELQADDDNGHSVTAAMVEIEVITG